jgi:hypothetical protein
VTVRTAGASVTVPVLSLTTPAVALAMLPTNAGSWNRTSPDGCWPVRVSMTEAPMVRMVSPRCRPPVVGKFARLMTWPALTHASLTSRPEGS